MTTKTIDFEDFLADQCDTHTNNDPAGFDKWLEELDGEQYMEFGQMYAEKVHEQSYLQGKQDMLDEVEQKIINPLKEQL